MKPLSNPELASFCGQLARIIHAGISALEGLTILREDVPAGDGQKLLGDMIGTMESGGSFSDAVAAAGEVFPPYMRNMIRLGDQAGKLDDVLSSLASYYQREDELSRSIKSAVTYPLVMLGMMMAVMLVLIIKVMPVFEQVFRQLGSSLTGVGGAVLRMGQTMSRYSVVFVVLAVALAGVCAYFFVSRKGRETVRHWSTRFVGTRKLSEKIACARFADGMHLALSSGLNIDESLETVSQLVEHPAVGKKVRSVRDMVAGGESLSEAIGKTGIFTGVYARMVSIGVKTGTVDDVMAQIAREYDAQVEQDMADAIAKLEPTLVAVLSVAVGMILLSVMLPLMGIMSNIG